MDFELSQELKMVQSLVRDFVTEQLKPLERDLMGRAAGMTDAMPSLPAETEQKLVKMAHDMGLWGTGVPEELGGAGLDVLSNCLVEEELAQTVIPFHFGDVSPILFECNAEQKEKFLKPALEQQKRAYLALMEPEKGDAVALDMIAERQNGHYVLKGAKLSLSRPAPDYFAMVFAKTEKEGKDAVTCFLVDRETPGFRVIDGVETSGWQAAVRRPMRLAFEDCRVSADSILGEEGKAFHLGKKWLPSRRVVRGARSVGVAQRLLEEATTQAQSWQSFGKLISGRTSVIGALADIAVGVRSARLMVYEAAWKADEGKLQPRDAAMVKLFTTQMLNRVADGVAHIWNAPPVIGGMPMQRLCQHALATAATDMALDAQRTIIARDLFKGLKV